MNSIYSTAGDVAQNAGVPFGSVIGDAVGGVASLFGGGASDPDLASKVWKNIKPTDTLTLDVLNVRAMTDGWHDKTTGAKLTTEDADFRSNTLMASLIGARVPAPKSAWLDNVTGQPLSNAEASRRWVSSYGASATLETVLATRNTALASSVPSSTAPGLTPTLPVFTDPGSLPGALSVPAPSTFPGVQSIPVAAVAAPGNTSATAARATVAAPWYKTPLGIGALVVGALLAVKLAKRG